MGMNTPLTFQINGEGAAISGDFMLLAKEVNPGIKALRASRLSILPKDAVALRTTASLDFYLLLTNIFPISP